MSRPREENLRGVQHTASFCRKLSKAVGGTRTHPTLTGKVQSGERFSLLRICTSGLNSLIQLGELRTAHCIYLSIFSVRMQMHCL
ncbi:hypothetical protein SNOG_06127 [Parastagonospora nodorum SN15]|uniref:Uncharacterized protein n=1 Tax=Phaeosphaeria nodorum (strain SN15 / ATCC MYA-4574 / FGSC 10173) TaxID=321614 RepID=Q0UQ37_PHANO|nr:hypothetical protein SNOG_06127 [Parastagonospora nodorum SN15]EAT85958.1 hypothetical protein SNOG_06127 [Parastagonospora nodorum SN15]